MPSLTASTAAPVSPPAVTLRLLSDERLARWASKGSEAAFAVIFERHHQALHRYCHSILGNGHDAADALQNTMLKALRALPGETRQIALKPWLYRIAHNESISLLRTRRGDSELDAAAAIGDPAADTIAESRERLRDLTADLGELTEQQRGALLMRELGGLAFADVAVALQITDTAAKQSVYEARCALQAMDEGRAMDCDVVRRTLSDGDRRTLRNMKLRGHLRDCSGCRDFEAALRHRPAQLAGLAPPLPLAAAASILHGLLGGGAGHGGGGLLAGLAIGAKSSGALSLGAAKVATVAVIAGGAAGGAVYVAPDGPTQRSESSPVTREAVDAGNRPASPLARRDGADADPPSARSAPRSADAASASTPDDDARRGGLARRPAAGSTPVPAASASPRPGRPTAGAAPGRRAEAVAGAGARRPAQSAPAPAAATSDRPTRRAPAPATAPVPAVAPVPTVAPVPATPAASGSARDIAAPAPSDAGAAAAATAPRPR